MGQSVIHTNTDGDDDALSVAIADRVPAVARSSTRRRARCADVGAGGLRVRDDTVGVCGKHLRYGSNPLPITQDERRPVTTTRQTGLVKHLGQTHTEAPRQAIERTEARLDIATLQLAKVLRRQTAPCRHLSLREAELTARSADHASKTPNERRCPFHRGDYQEESHQFLTPVGKEMICEANV